MKPKRIANPTAFAVISDIIGLGNSDNILNTMSAMGERIHKNVASAIRQAAFFLCPIYVFASSIEIFFTSVLEEVLVNSSSSLSSFKR